FQSRRLPIMLFGLLPLLCFLEHPTKLVLDSGFRRGFAQALEQYQGFVVTLHGVSEIAFWHGQRAELREDDSLVPQVVQFLERLQAQFILAPGLAEFALVPQYIGQVRSEASAMPLDLIVQLQLLRHRNAMPTVRFRKIGVTTSTVAAAKTTER